jgi:peptidyl-prolyl cis-trans isomerase A (cyclophilin A)
MTKTLLLAAALAAAPAALAQAPTAEHPRTDAPPRAAAAKGKDLYATFVTSRGKIGVHLLPSEAPKAVQNFVELAEGKKEWTDPETGQKVRRPLYDGTLFHRVIPNFMVQGGDPISRGAPLGASRSNAGRLFGMSGPGYEFEDELQKGTTPFAKPCQLAMANHGPNTNGSQFFLTEVPTPHLNPVPCDSRSGTCGYVHMGEGVCGCDLVGQIARAGNSQTRLEKVVISSTPPTCR